MRNFFKRLEPASGLEPLTLGLRNSDSPSKPIPKSLKSLADTVAPPGEKARKTRSTTGFCTQTSPIGGGL